MSIRMISTLAASVLLAACSSSDAVKVQTSQSAICDALRPDMPVPEMQYHSTGDTPDTVARAKANNLHYRRANARFNAACS